MDAPKPLTIAQVRQLREFTDPRAADTLAVVMSTGCDKAEAEEAYDTWPAGQWLDLLKAVFNVSGMGEGAQFQS